MPTSSTTSQLALGDALAIASMKNKNFGAHGRSRGTVQIKKSIISIMICALKDFGAHDRSRGPDRHEKSFDFRKI